MKLKKIISLLSSLAVMGTMMANVYAAPDADNAELIVDAVYSEDAELYCVEYTFNTVGDLGVTKTGTKYSGTALYAFSMVINGGAYANINEDYYVEIWDDADVIEDNDAGLAIGKLQTNAAKKLATADGEPNLLIRIYTNYALNDKTEAEIAAEYSDLSNLNIKTVTVTEAGANNNPTTVGDIVTYAINDDGTKHPDANYGIKVVVADKATGGEEDDGEITLVDGVELTGDYAGFKTFSASAPIALSNNGETGSITVTLDKEQGRELTHDLPAGVVGGISKVLPIVSYNMSEVTEGTFSIVIKIGEATTTYT